MLKLRELIYFSTRSNNGWMSLDSNDILYSEDIINNLMIYGFIDNDGKITPRGEKALAKVAHRMEQLKKGLPIEERKSTDPDLIKYGGTVFSQGKIEGKKNWYSDGFILLIGNPSPGLQKTKEPPSRAVRASVTPMFKKAASNKNNTEIRPFAFQISESKITELIWLADRNGGTVKCINSMYYDFLCNKYKDIRFLCNPQGAHNETPILLKAVHKGPVGLLMPMESQKPPIEPPVWDSDNAL